MNDPKKKEKKELFSILDSGIKAKKALSMPDQILQNRELYNLFSTNLKKISKNSKNFEENDQNESIEKFEIFEKNGNVKKNEKNEKNDNICKNEINKTNESISIEKTVENNYVGLSNQGATCYLNSILQSLFHIPVFRSLIFRIPYEITHQISESDEKPSDRENVILNLQILFAELQLFTEPVSTDMLTDSFGWEENQISVQQDIAEFLTELLSYFEEKLKGTNFLHKFLDLFSIHVRTFYRGISCSFEESSDDSFFLLAVPVKGFSNLNDSLKSVASIQILEGKNKYKSRKYGPQDASLKSQFLKLPKVLVIQLKRYEIDQSQNSYYKVNSKFEFTEKLNTSDFLPENDPLCGIEYELHSVVIHSGSNLSGHYYCYIRPDLSQQWYKFDDSAVTAVNREEAIENNFGGFNSGFSFLWPKKEKTYSAYLLFYMRKDSLSEIFCPIDNSVIPEKVHKFLREKSQNLNQIQINITTEESLLNNALKGKLSFESSKKYTSSLSLPNSFTSKNLFESIAFLFDISPVFINMYLFNDNCLTRKISKSDSDDTLHDLIQNNSTLFCFAHEENKNSNEKSNKVVFLFLYIPVLNHPLRYLVKICVNEESSITKTLKEKTKEELNLNSLNSKELSFFVKNGPILTLISNEKLKFRNFQSSMYVVEISKCNDIQDIILQNGFLKQDGIKYSSFSTNYFDYVEKMPQSASEYYNQINYKTVTKLKIVSQFDNFIKIKYPNCILLSEFFDFIKKIIHIEKNENVLIYKAFDILPVDYFHDQSNHVFDILGNPKYLIINISNDFENIALIEIIISLNSLSQANRFPILVSIGTTIEYLLNQLHKSLPEFKKVKFLRAIQLNEVNNETFKGIVRILKNDELINDLKNPIRIEPVPDSQIEVSPDNLVPVLFNNKKSGVVYNFYLEVIKNEYFADTKKRIKDVLKLSDALVSKLGFEIRIKNHGKPLRDDSIVSEYDLKISQIKIVYLEKIDNMSIKIYN